MFAAVMYGIEDIRLVEMEKPSPGAGEVLVQVKEVGICASDVHWYREGRIADTVVTKPIILGHEFSGIIAEVGEGVTNVRPGDRVAVEPGKPCLACDMCATEDFNLCRNVEFHGTTPIDGAFRQFLAWPARLVEKIPDSMTTEEAAMLEPFAVGLYCIDLAGDVRGKTLGILGAGAIGLSVLQSAVSSGCTETFVTDPLPGRRDRAARLGAKYALDAADPDLPEKVMRLTHGRGLDIVVEAAGENEAVRQAMRLVRPAGRIVVCGIPVDDELCIPTALARRKLVTFRFVRRSNKTLERSIEMIARGKADVACYGTHHFPLERITEAFEVAANQKDKALRVVIQVS
jgi:L-iditol 2-dehydrogenase